MQCRENLTGVCGMQDASAQNKALQSARKGSSSALNALSPTPGVVSAVGF